MDLHNDPEFQALDVALVSIAFDPREEQLQGIQEFGISDEVPMLIDAEQNVSEAYDVLQWAVRSGEPGHTFVLVGEDGEVAWIQDYGAPENGGVMYVPPDDLIFQIRQRLEA